MAGCWKTLPGKVTKLSEEDVCDEGRTSKFCLALCSEVLPCPVDSRTIVLLLVNVAVSMSASVCET